MGERPLYEYFEALHRWTEKQNGTWAKRVGRSCPLETPSRAVQLTPDPAPAPPSRPAARTRHSVRRHPIPKHPVRSRHESRGGEGCSAFDCEQQQSLRRRQAETDAKARDPNRFVWLQGHADVIGERLLRVPTNFRARAACRELHRSTTAVGLDMEPLALRVVEGRLADHRPMAPALDVEDHVLTQARASRAPGQRHRTLDADSCSSR